MHSILDQVLHEALEQFEAPAPVTNPSIQSAARQAAAAAGRAFDQKAGSGLIATALETAADTPRLLFPIKGRPQPLDLISKSRQGTPPHSEDEFGVRHSPLTTPGSPLATSPPKSEIKKIKFNDDTALEDAVKSYLRDQNIIIPRANRHRKTSNKETNTIEVQIYEKLGRAKRAVTISFAIVKIALSILTLFVPLFFRSVRNSISENLLGLKKHSFHTIQGAQSGFRLV